MAVSKSAASPLILHGRSGTRARLDGDAFVLEQGGALRRIPLSAIARVEIAGRGDRTLRVTLTAAPGDQPAHHAVRCASAPAVRAFAAALTEAVPVRDAAERQAERAARVPLERVARWRLPRLTAQTWMLVAVAGGLSLAGSLGTAAAGSSGSRL
ncbi:hypothetical protein ACFQLX_13850 [Streptomyces polyrhachis]|uniref:Uncharacterized protein n=1 Tax=Streptomyces polyrhachis TaxID=1282885 RepID=A0ABW2GHZ9_9ACTN